MIEVDITDLIRAEAMDIHKWLVARSREPVEVVKVQLSAGGILENGTVLLAQYNHSQHSETWLFVGLLAAWLPTLQDPATSGLRFRFENVDEALLFKLTFGGK